MLCFSMVNSVSAVLLMNIKLVFHKVSVQHNYDTIHIIMGIVGIAVCLLTALQLGLDQLPIASGDNITSFISWFVVSVCAVLWLFN